MRASHPRIRRKCCAHLAAATRLRFGVLRSSLKKLPLAKNTLSDHMPSAAYNNLCWSQVESDEPRSHLYFHWSVNFYFYRRSPICSALVLKLLTLKHDKWLSIPGFQSPARRNQWQISAATEFNRKGQANGHGDNNVPSHGAKCLAINKLTFAGPRSIGELREEGGLRLFGTPYSLKSPRALVQDMSWPVNSDVISNANSHNFTLLAMLFRRTCHPTKVNHRTFARRFSDFFLIWRELFKDSFNTLPFFANSEMQASHLFKGRMRNDFHTDTGH
jgi:hypothetical protein